tara:strand:- start:1902 stop:2579 length:678 start_codon:yes stop_codon:yes gene_type:complete
MATTTANDILNTTQNYGKAQTAFSIAMAQASNQREQAMIGLGADFTTQGGNVITPNEGGVVLGGAGLPTGTAIRTGFGEGALPTVAKTQAGAVYQQEQALLEKGVGGGSGVTGQAKLITQDQGALETQVAVQDFQGKVAEANVAQGVAKLDLATAAGDLATAQEKKLPVGKRKPAKPVPKTPAQLAKIRTKNSSARAAANQKAIKAGKPMPYGKGGTVKPKKRGK